jgi:hypothetical protein
MNCLKLFFGLNLAALEVLLLSLKARRCPFCICAESLNQHSILYGKHPDRNCADKRCVRGQRIYCSNRGQRGGCGRTFPAFLADVFPRFSVTALLLWKLLSAMTTSGSILAAIHSVRLPFGTETLYHLVDRLRLRLDEVRSRLSQITPAPASSQSDPLLQTVEHFKAAFPKADGPLQAYQIRFQAALLG